ncbi:hypothetical protein TWF694_005440 [Orbilia ellipsospora]|uniref:F-box domain-containing protein n=1 Tax=Orbilia ellipsospora TaxID=2528407 RepID=A0AAV9WT41_9PEZI
MYHLPCPRQKSVRAKSPVRCVFQENGVQSKIVCLENDQALLWPQYSVQTATTDSQRRVIEEVIQYLLDPADSAVLVKPVHIRRQKKCMSTKIGLTTIPTEIHLMISEYLDDYDSLCLSLTSRTLFNRSVGRMQKIVSSGNTIGCWAGKPLVLSNPNNPSATATAVEAQYLDQATDAVEIKPTRRANETLYQASFPEKRVVLHGIAHDMYIPQVIRRFVSALLRDKEYENLFCVGEEYVLRNLDRMEYVDFNTGKIKSTVVDVGKFMEGEDVGMTEILHEAEVLIDAISCVPNDSFSPEKFEKGSWAGCRMDIVSKKRVETEKGWVQAGKPDIVRSYIKPEEARGRYFRDANGTLRDRSVKERSGGLKRDKSVGRRNRMYSFLGQEKFVLPAVPRVTVEGRIVWA